ncbi:hypothetical protein [Sphingobacterium siyangense]
MKLKKYIAVILYALSSTAVVSAQYKEPEKKDKIEALYPQAPFDSLQAKQWRYANDSGVRVSNFKVSGFKEQN